MSEERMSTGDLVFAYKETFHSKIDASSLLEVMVEKKWIKKKQKKTLDSRDDATRSSFLHSMFCNSVLAPQDFIDLVKQTKHEKNLEFAVHLQKTYDESRKHEQLQIVESKLTTSVEGQTLLQEQDSMAEVVVENLTGDTIAEMATENATMETAISGSTFIHMDPTEPASGVFVSEGGILYSPYHGVTIYIPKGAIPEGQRVSIRFRPEVESKELDKFLSHPLVEGSLLCSHLFNFDAELLGGEGSEEFGSFSQDVWIELPYAHFKGCTTSKRSIHSLLYVVSQCGDNVHREDSAVFGFGYPYANICVRHFSGYAVLTRRQKYFIPDLPKKKEPAYLKKKSSVLDGMRQNSGSFEEDVKGSPKSKSKETCKLVSEHSKDTSSFSSECATVFKQASLDDDKKCRDGDLNEDKMDVDAACELLPYDYGTPLCLLFFVFQPKDRHKRKDWVADVFIFPNLPEAYTIIDFYQYDKVDCSGACPFSVSVSCDCVFIDGDFSVQNGWTANLLGEQISLFTFRTINNLFSNMLSLASNYVPPKCEVRITNTGSKEKLKYSISVRPSHPPVSYELTSDVLYNLTDTEKPEAPPRAVSAQAMKVDWSTDRPLFAILSLIVHRKFVKSISRALGLSDDCLQHIQSNTSSAGVGELQYQVFLEVLSKDLETQNLSFSKYLDVFTRHNLGLSVTVKDRIVHIIRSYINYKQLGYHAISTTDGTAVEKGCHNLLRFLGWAEVTLECLQVPRPSQKPISSESQRQNLFKTLSIRIIHVWKMIARLLLLEDHVIDRIEYASTHDMSLGTPGDMCCQMLFSWAEQAMNQSDNTYDNLTTVLRIIACCHGNRLVADALYCIQNVTVDLSSLDISDAGV